MLVKKASGQLEEFSAEKLRTSLLEAGATPEIAESILNYLRSKVKNGISTKRLYQLAFKQLKKSSRPIAARYSLKRAIIDFGPSGYPFEKYISFLFKLAGYEVQTNQVLTGRCVGHEIDVVGSRDQTRVFVECKFHNQTGKTCNVKTSLYVQARSQDLNSHPDSKHAEFWLVTNTRFTSDAIAFGTCMNLKLLSWGYPRHSSLEKLIEHTRLHPLTCLTTLKNWQKEKLLERERVVLCQELLDTPELLSRVGVRKHSRTQILNEIKELLATLPPPEQDAIQLNYLLINDELQ